MTQRTVLLVSIVAAFFFAACEGSDDTHIEDLEATVTALTLEATITAFTDDVSANDSLQDYFSELEALYQGYAELDTLDKEAGEVEVLVNFVKTLRSATNDLVGSLAGLGAPAEVTEASVEAIAAGRALVDMYDNILTIAEVVETYEDATLLLESPGLVGVLGAFTEACGTLQGIAATNSISVDLHC